MAARRRLARPGCLRPDSPRTGRRHADWTPVKIAQTLAPAVRNGRFGDPANAGSQGRFKLFGQSGTHGRWARIDCRHKDCKQIGDSGLDAR
jgi:hypothetical protein